MITIPRRTKVQIYMDIMRAIRKAGGRLKITHIVYKANLTHTRVQPYLDFLRSNGFLEEEKTGKANYFVITKKGNEFLSEANKLKELSDAFGLQFY